MISRKRVVEAVFLSVLDYGDVMYRHVTASTLKQLDSVYHTWNALQQTLKVEVLLSATLFKCLLLNLCSSNCNCF